VQERCGAVVVPGTMVVVVVPGTGTGTPTGYRLVQCRGSHSRSQM